MHIIMMLMKCFSKALQCNTRVLHRTPAPAASTPKYELFSETDSFHGSYALPMHSQCHGDGRLLLCFAWHREDGDGVY